MSELSGKTLNMLWKIGAKHALYREDGKWYHNLKEFPGALFDANGYVIFETEGEYLNSPYLQLKQDLHVVDGISKMPNYVRVSESENLQPLSRSIRRIAETVGPKSYKSGPIEFHDPHVFDPVSRSSILVDRIVRDTKLSAWVKYLYQYRCQLCGNTLEMGSGRLYAESHHVKPLGNPHDGPDVIENILCVCPNDHVLLDYGAIKVEKSLINIVSGHQISEDYIHYHNSVIFSNLI